MKKVRRIKKNSIYDVHCSVRNYLLQPNPVSATRTIFLGMILVAHLVEMMDSAVLDGVVKILSSNLARAINIFSAFTRIVLHHFI